MLAVFCHKLKSFKILLKRGVGVGVTKACYMFCVPNSYCVLKLSYAMQQNINK